MKRLSKLAKKLNRKFDIKFNSEKIHKLSLIHSDSYYINLGYIITIEQDLYDKGKSTLREDFDFFEGACTTLYPNLAYLLTILQRQSEDWSQDTFEGVVEFMLNNYYELGLDEIIERIIS